MTSAIRNEVNLTYRYLEGYVALLIVYWVILASIELLQHYLEKKMSKPYVKDGGK